MKIAPRDIERFLRDPGPQVRAVLVYGPDAGLVRERAASLVTLVVDDPADPFRVSELSARDLRDDPARLADEAAALALTGGRRVVRVRPAEDSVAEVFRTFLEAPAGEALVVAEAGDLPARSALRKAFERAATGAAVACYLDDARTLPRVIETELREAGLGVSPEALDYLVANLGGDRQVTRREIEKLALFAAGRERVELADARACVGDTAALTLYDLALAVGDGDLAALERNYARSLQEGTHAVAVLRAVARHLQRLHLLAGWMAEGRSFDEAARKLRPPVFWKVAPRVRAQAGAWPPAALAAALDRLVEAECAAKRTGAPAEALCGMALVAIAAKAARRLPKSGR